MMDVIEQIKDLLVQELSQVYGTPVARELLQFQKTRKDFNGDQTLVVFPLLKMAKKSPEQSAQQIGELLVAKSEVVDHFDVVKGFLNISFTTAYWLSFFQQVVSSPDFGFAAPNSGRKIMLEYSSPNTNKPLHLGHIRNNLLGFSVANILEANGHEIIKANLINDRGIHICKSMLAWQKWGDGETPEQAGIKGDHLVGKYYVMSDTQFRSEVKELIATGMAKDEAEQKAPFMQEARAMLTAWEKGDPAVIDLWKTMNAWVYEGFEDTYGRLGVAFDQFYYESNTYIHGKAEVQKGLDQGILYQKEDGSVWANLEPDGLDHKILLRSDGTSVYMTQDLGTAIQRFEEHADLDQLIYTVGNEQDYHFNVLFLILRKLGYSWAKDCHHLSYGMVELPKGMGRMKTREGTVVDADELIQEMVDTARAKSEELGKLDGLNQEEKEQLYDVIGLGALKYFMLKVDPKKKMVFDPQESVDFQGNTGPFIQYAHARIHSIVRKVEVLEKVPSIVALEESEQVILRTLFEFPNVIQEAGANYSPALVANFCYDLVKAFNSFYQNVSILKEGDPDKRMFRVQLAAVTGQTLKRAMNLLGIELPSQM